MFKARTLPFNYGLDLGPGHRYCSTSSSLGKIAQAQDAGWNTFERLKEARSYGIDNALLAFAEQPGTVGYETFSSTHNRPPHFNICTHSVYGGVNYPYTAAYEGYRGNCYAEYFFRTTPGCGTEPIERLLQHYNIDLSTAQRTAYGIMQPRFEGDISMFNFIVEMKDFKSLARFLMNKPIRKLSNMFKRLRRKPKFDPTKPIAQLHLANEFALKPLISDIVKIAMQMDAMVADVQQDFADAGRERNTRHYTEEFDVSRNSCMDPYYDTRYPEKFWGKSEQFTFTATMEYSYEYNMRSTLDAFIKYWGIAPDAEAIWNVLPFSFLLDYVLKVGNALAINSRDKNVLLNLTQYCESYLSERTSGFHFNGSALVGPLLGTSQEQRGGQGRYLVAGLESTLYSRIVTTPKTGPVMPRLAKPTSKQGWNVLALTRCFF